MLYVHLAASVLHIYIRLISKKLLICTEKIVHNVYKTKMSVAEKQIDTCA